MNKKILNTTHDMGWVLITTEDGQELIWVEED